MRIWFAAVALAVAGTATACGDEPARGDDAGSPDDAKTSGPDAAMPPDATPHVWACAPDRVAGHQAFTCPASVAASVEASAACVAGGCGVILDVHGYTMTADQEDQHTRMRALAPPRGYVVVQPTAPGAVPSWDLGAYDAVAWELLEAVIDVFAIDPDRVHVTGFSQGGMMSYRLLCEHADRLASIAPVAGGGCFDGSNAPAIERPILYVHGHLDTIVPWATVAVPQREAVLAAWDFGEPTTIDTGAGFVARRWTTGAGTPFEMWEHDFGTGDVILAGHCLPGPGDNYTFRCDASGFDATSVILDFFDAHPR